MWTPADFAMKCLFEAHVTRIAPGFTYMEVPIRSFDFAGVTLCDLRDYQKGRKVESQVLMAIN
jgi:hypothetical protein